MAYSSAAKGYQRKGYSNKGSSYGNRRGGRNLLPVTKPPRFTPPGGWNQESLAVFDFIENGTGHGAIEAVAGGGKTTTVVEGAIRVCEKFPKAKVLFVAFNVSIKEEGQRRLAGYNVDVMTVHGLGHRTIMKPGAWGGPDGRAQFDVQDSKGSYMMSLAENELGFEKEKRDDREALLDLIGKAKTCLKDDVDGLMELMDRFGIETSYSRQELAESALKIMAYNRERPRMVQIDGRGKAAGRKFSKIALTFDDQCWLPIVNNWNVEQYDVVFVDEAQDLSPARRELIRKALKPGGRLFVVGDRFQCVAGDTPVATKTGTVLACDLQVGDKVLSWRNNAVVEQTVRHINLSSWSVGRKIKTASGKELSMSPNHKIWASDFVLKGQEHLVYLMFRSDLGFRVGITNKYASPTAKLGQRTQSEGAEKLWILKVCKDREEALYYEQMFSLEYGIPTCVFNGTSRGLNQQRIDDVFAMFGNNGVRLLRENHMHFDYSNWTAHSCTTGPRQRLVIKLVAHGSKNTTLSFEWSEDYLSIKSKLEANGFAVTAAKKDGRLRVRKWYPSYRNALIDAEQIVCLVPGSFISEKLHTPSECLNLVTASALHVGMRVAVRDGEVITTEEIVSIEEVESEFYDIDVDDASNFFGGDILSHNSIYGFAGADIDSLPRLIEEFSCKLLPLSYSWRCAPNVVAEAQQFNPNIQANPAKVGVEDGIVDVAEAGDLLEALKPGEVLLSRTNAPLIRVFFQLARRQVKVKFIGRDYGKMLAYRIRGWKFRHENAVMKGHASGPFTGRLMLEYNDEWLQMQGKNRSKSEDDDESGINDRMRDEHATVQALTVDLASSLDSDAAVTEILERCNAFSPEEKPGESSGSDYVTLSSTHRFKGLERDHAHVLIDTYKPGKDQEETNLLYVSVTRAKKHLTYVKGKPGATSVDGDQAA